MTVPITAKTYNSERSHRCIQKLRNALIQQMGDTSIEALTVVDICKKAGVNRMTFYRYYKDKYVLLADTVRELLCEAESAITDEAGLDNIDSPCYVEETERRFLRIFVRKIVEMCDLYESHFRIMNDNGCSVAQNIIKEVFCLECKRVFDFCINMRINSIPFDMICELFQGSIMNVMQYRINQTDKNPIDEFVAEVCAMAWTRQFP